MSKKLFVGGLPFTVTSSQLEEIFSKFGKVTSCDVIIDRYSGQSKGFGFVEMADDKEADKAIEKLNETDLEGRKIVVNVARPREERPRFDNRGGDPRRDSRNPGRGGYR
ncbi:MAG TPA: RNA-binding protein [Candidatus Bathyarchaeia archaeon]|nr:RNA-binding protein [Candidatus Bathyarchaeia archaeon]